MKAIEIENLSKCYRISKQAGIGMSLPRVLPWQTQKSKSQRAPTREVWALRNINLDVEPGSTVGVIGANGAGKSTLLKVLARVTPPTAGSARVIGRVMPLLELGAGALHPDATARENIRLYGALYGVPRSIVEARMEEMIEFAGVEDFADIPVRKFSSGMALRLAFSMVINSEPDILLADEVLAVGDIVFQERCLRKVEEGGAHGLTTLFVSHDMMAVTRLCQRVIWIHDGKVIADGEPDDVIGQYEESSWTLLGGEEQGEGVVTENEHARLARVRLVSDLGEEVGAVTVADDFGIELTLEIREPGISVRCAVAFLAEGASAFRSVQPEPLEADPGTYVATVKVPKHLLADITYSVKVGVYLSDDKGVVGTLVRNNGAVVRVYDTDEAASARGSYVEAMPGLVRPKLDWVVDAVTPSR